MNTNHPLNNPTDARRRSIFSFPNVLMCLFIAGILVAIVGVQLDGKSLQARVVATEASMRSIITAIEMYQTDNLKPPPSLAALMTGKKRYLEGDSLPLDAWGKEFRYYLKGDLVVLRSPGPDGIIDTEDDVATE